MCVAVCLLRHVTVTVWLWFVNLGFAGDHNCPVAYCTVAYGTGVSTLVVVLELHADSVGVGAAVQF